MSDNIFKLILLLVSGIYIFLLFYFYDTYYPLINYFAICITILSNLLTLYFLLPEKYTYCCKILYFILNTGVVLQMVWSIMLMTYTACSEHPEYLKGRFSVYAFMSHSIWFYILPVFLLISRVSRYRNIEYQNSKEIKIEKQIL